MLFGRRGRGAEQRSGERCAAHSLAAGGAVPVAEIVARQPAHPAGRQPARHAAGGAPRPVGARFSTRAPGMDDEERSAAAHWTPPIQRPVGARFSGEGRHSASRPDVSAPSPSGWPFATQRAVEPMPREWPGTPLPVARGSRGPFGVRPAIGLG